MGLLIDSDDSVLVLVDVQEGFVERVDDAAKDGLIERIAFLVHGGPQGAWEDGWSYRWNPQVWAAQGYVVALPNPRGSTGFGQKFVDEISADWGGKCYVDLMKCLEHLEEQPWIDKERMGAAGASFGGYMMNWFQGNTTKFKTLITHCGVYNFDSMYAGTDEPYLFGRRRTSGPDPQRGSYRSFASFRDPDGNGWLFQEITTRLPGRIAGNTSFASASDLASALRRAATAHGEHEKRTAGQRDENWPDWYAEYMVREQAGEELPQ